MSWKLNWIVFHPQVPTIEHYPRYLLHIRLIGLMCPKLKIRFKTTCLRLNIISDQAKIRLAALWKAPGFFTICWLIDCLHLWSDVYKQVWLLHGRSTTTLEDNSEAKVRCYTHSMDTWRMFLVWCLGFKESGFRSWFDCMICMFVCYKNWNGYFWETAIRIWQV